MEDAALLQQLQSNLQALDATSKRISGVLWNIKRFEQTDALKLKAQRQALAKKTAERIQEMDEQTLRYISYIIQD